jgi:signal peptidase I
VAFPVPQPEPQPASRPPAEAEARRQKSVFREYAEALAIAVALALFIRTFFVQAYKIPSGSMEPTLLIGDHLLVNKVAYGLRMPESILGLTPFANSLPYGKYLFSVKPVGRGDVVVFIFPEDQSKDFIKRVIAVAGDTIAVKDGKLYLNGSKVADPHAHFELPEDARSDFSPRDNFGPVTVPKGELFMMGDNRDHSYDSRFWGFVKRDAVEGRAIFIYWSWKTEGSSFLSLRWSRIGQIIR